jgi:hypothetical protein
VGPWLKRNAWLVAIAAAYLYIFPHFPKTRNANELPRAYLVKAMVDDHTFAIDRGVKTWGRTADVAEANKRFYSNKAPGSSMLVAPAYAVVSLFGEPSLDFTIWLSRIVAGVIPTLLFLVLLWRFLERFAPDPDVRRVVIVAYALGSMAMTFSVLFISHQLSAICVGSAWILGLDFADRKRGIKALIAAGFLAGCAPLVDYQAAFAVPIIAGHVLWKLRGRPAKDKLVTFGIVAAAAAPPIILLLVYHHQAFGSPLCNGYDPSCVQTQFANLQNQGFLGLGSFRWHAFVGSTVSPDNGLFTLAPWLLLAIPGFVLLARRQRSFAITCGLIAVMYIAFVSSLAMWRAGWSVGPRYITVMLPFLLPAIAVVLQEWRAKWWLFGLAAGTVLVGITIYSLSSATFPPWPDEYILGRRAVHIENPLFEITFRLLGDGMAAPNVLTAIAGGPPLVGILPYLAIVFGVAGWTIAKPAGWRALVVAVGVAVAILVIYSLLPGTPNTDEMYRRIVNFMT